MVKVRALKDYQDPHEPFIHVAGSDPFDHDDPKLVTFLVEMNHLVYVDEEGNDITEAIPVAPTPKVARKPTKAELSSGTNPNTGV